MKKFLTLLVLSLIAVLSAIIFTACSACDNCGGSGNNIGSNEKGDESGNGNGNGGGSGQHTHNYVWIITNPATCTEDGERTGTCVDGDYSYTEKIAALGHNYENGVCIVCGEKEPTSGEYFTFTLLENDTYEINAKELNNMPSIVRLPSTYNGKPVTSIGEEAFSGCSGLTEIIIPDSVTSIGKRAFEDCSSLTEVVIPEVVTSIEGGAFSGCDNLQYNEYDKGLYLGNENNPYLILVKVKSRNITSCIINENTKFIHSQAFAWCYRLTEITIPEAVTSIGWDAFYICSKLTEVIISEAVTSIGSSAFYNCSSLTSVTIGNSVTSIGNGAFRDCSNLTSINYAGTIEQWNAISKGDSWNYNVPATVVHCIGDDVSI